MKKNHDIMYMVNRYSNVEVSKMGYSYNAFMKRLGFGNSELAKSAYLLYVNAIKKQKVTDTDK